MDTNVYTFSFPTLIHSGPGALSKLPTYLKDKKYFKPLVVTDAVLVDLQPFKILHDVMSSESIDFSIYSNFSGNPIEGHVTKGLETFNKGTCNAIIAFGGGAAIDVAKAIAVMVNNPGSLFDYEDVEGAKPITGKLPPVIAIPTTAGTGSEVGRSSVISENESHAKKIIFTPAMLPELAILDAKLTLGLPASVTATTGMDALTHLMEAYLARGYQPMCDGIALEGMALVSKHLKKAVKFAQKKVGETPEHLESRQKMLEASMMGAVAFQKGLGVTHSCAHALSTICDLHHGLANGVLLPYTMKFNSKEVPERFETMAKILSLKGGKPKDVIEWIVELKKDIEVPKSLSEVGVKKDHLDALVGVAIRDVCHPLNPRRVSEDDFIKIFEKAI